MARQPFLPTYKDTPTAMGADMIERLPQVAALVGRIVTNWSSVDLQLALTLGSLLGVENPAAVAVFLALKQHRTQREVLTAAAEKTIRGELKEVFDALLSLHGSLDKQRNDVVHCVWGEGKATPDGIIWSSLQDHAKMLLNDYHLSETGQLNAEERPAQITKDYFVVRYQDLEELNASIMQFARLLGHFHGHIRYKGKIQGDNAYASLMKDPMLTEALARLREKKPVER